MSEQEAWMALSDLSSPSPRPRLARYDIQEELGSGGMGVVYQAVDRLTGLPVALKRVIGSNRRTSPETALDVRIALAQEFRTLASLRHPNIISVLDYGFHQGHAYYTMELLDGSQTIVEAAQGKPYQTQVDYLLQVLQALAYLHNRGIIHRDLKPDNLLVVNDHVKVLDFGLATAREFFSDEYQHLDVMGTMAYMAPEVVQGQPSSQTSDLYAIGLIAYEMLTNTYPYAANDVAAMITSIISDTPDFSRLDSISETMRSLLENLLSKSSRRRYQNATAVIDLLRDEIREDDAHEEDSLIRESYLRAARFIGRRQELSLLTTTLEKLIKEVKAPNGYPQGSFWLVAGEAGVGKSRLLDELRIRAQVRGALVLRGQSVASGDASFRTWQHVLRELSLYADISDMETAVLRAIVPDMDSIINRSLPHAVTLDQISSQERLFETVQQLIRRTGQPVLIILEDLQWARQSLVLLRRLLDVLHDLPVMIVGSYRDEETPDLPDQLGNVDDQHLIKLHRLTSGETADLSRSMLGEAGKLPEVIELMQRETEGNAFFIVEVARTLAEITGERTLIGRATLPPQVFLGGIRSIVEQRLARLPKEALPPLRIAAAVGRAINIDLMTTMMPALDIDEWLHRCQRAAVLEVNGTTWRFSHDKIREGVLLQIPADRVKIIHQQIAMGIETMTGESGRLAAADDLFYHWSHTDDRNKRTFYAALAGKHALTISDYGTAVHMLNLALEDFSEISDSSVTLAELAQSLALAHYGLSHMENCIAYVQIALKAMKMPSLPKSNVALTFKLMVQIIRQIVRRSIPWMLRPVRESNRDRYLKAAQLHSRASQAYVFLNTPQQGALSVLYALNLAERGGRSPILSFSYVGFGYLCAMVPLLHSQVNYYLSRGEQVASEQLTETDNQDAAMALHAASLARTGLGQIDQALELSKQASRLFEIMRDMRHWSESVATQAFLLEFRGEFEQATMLRQRLHERGLATNNLRPSMWGLAGLSQIAINVGKFSKARAYLAERLDLSEREAGSASNNLTFSTYMCLLYWRMQRDDQAYEHLKIASTELATESMSQIHSAYLFLNTAEVAVRMCQIRNNPELHNLARLNIDRLRRYSRTFPLVRPQTNIIVGLYHWNEGQSRRAYQLWNRGLSAAANFNMPYVEAQAHLEIGRHLPNRDPKRAEHLQKAKRLFEQVGAQYDADSIAD
jgi:tetratricopeptide (TPR) repeat protein